jgi:N-methylhydantoinase A
MLRNSIKQISGIRLAADIGGTFTDIAVFDEKTNRLLFGKSLSTPSKLVDGIADGVEKAGAHFSAANLLPNTWSIWQCVFMSITGLR